LAYQTSSRVLAAIRRETTAGTAATVTGASQIRLIGSPGLKLNRARIESNEKRTDALKQMPRLGYKSVDGSFNSELSAGGHHDLLLEAVQRNAASTATSIGFATLTTVAVGTNQVVAAAGDWVAQGIRVGDIFTLSGTSVSGNHAVNARVVAVTSLTISVPPATFTTLAASATGTLTRAKKMINGTTPTSFTHSIEQYDQDIDVSELFLGCMCVGVNLSFRPGQMATAQYTFLGMDRTALATGTSPYFTSPTLTTSLQLVADDSSIRYNGAQVATFTGFDLNFQITAAGEPVIGSLVTPAIFDNDMMASGSITGLRSDFSNLTLFDAETEFDVSILLEEPTGSPPAFLSVFLPRVKLAGIDAPIGGGDGAKIETLEIVTGPKTAATGYDGTVAAFHSSAA
jgi:hypothetical protein